MAIRVRGIGPVYWGYDPEHTGSASSYAWVVETTPPYRKSKWGHLFAIGHRAIHFGFCVREKDPKEIARWEGQGLDVTPDEIAEWRGPSNFSQASGEVEQLQAEILANSSASLGLYMQMQAEADELRAQ